MAGEFFCARVAGNAGTAVKCMAVNRRKPEGNGVAGLENGLHT